MDMKKLTSVFMMMAVIVAAVFLSGCNRHDEPEREVYVPIIYQFNQESVIVDLDYLSENEPEIWDQLKSLHFHTFVVNDAHEFPSCDLIKENWGENIDFSDKTVIINYELCSYPVVGHRYAWVYDRMDKTYSFWTTNLTDGDRLLDDAKACLVRNAIMVNKISPSVHVTSVFSSPSHI